MFELQDATLRTIAYGMRDEMFHAVKHRVCDGRYRIVGPHMQFYCIRREGEVYPDPARVPMQPHVKIQQPALQYFA